MRSEKDWPQYDKEVVYDAEIAPLMEQIIAICKRAELPMFATFAYANDEDGDGLSFCTTALQGPGGWQPDQIKRCWAEVKRGPSVFAYTITTSKPGEV